MKKQQILVIIFSTMILMASSLSVHAMSSNEIFNAVNTERISHNLKALESNEILNTVAQNKAEAIVQAQILAHNLPDRPFYTFVDDSEYKYDVLGENLAVDYLDTNSTINAWMQSPSHRKNILDDRYTQTGIAVLPITLGGRQTILTVQIFAKPSPSTVTIYDNQIKDKNVKVNLNTSRVTLGTSLLGISTLLGLTIHRYTRKKY